MFCELYLTGAKHPGSRRTAGRSESLQLRVVYESTSTGHASFAVTRVRPSRGLRTAAPAGGRSPSTRQTRPWRGKTHTSGPPGRLMPSTLSRRKRGNSNDRQRCGNKSRNPRLDGNLMPFLVCAALPL